MGASVYLQSVPWASCPELCSLCFSGTGERTALTALWLFWVVFVREPGAGWLGVGLMELDRGLSSLSLTLMLF